MWLKKADHYKQNLVKTGSKTLAQEESLLILYLIKIEKKDNVNSQTYGIIALNGMC